MKISLCFRLVAAIFLQVLQQIVTAGDDGNYHTTIGSTSAAATVVIDDAMGTITNVYQRELIDGAIDWNKLSTDVVGELKKIDLEAYSEECLPEFLKESPVDHLPPRFERQTIDAYGNISIIQVNFTNSTDIRSNWNLIKKESGICSVHFWCAFDQCNPIKTKGREFSVSEIWEAQGAFTSSPGKPQNGKYFNIGPVTPYSWLEPTNVDFNLPQQVLFPKNAGDVVRAIKFARMHNLKISTKTSGMLLLIF